VRDRDEILVQLFVRGYGVQPHEVREALRQEFLKARAKLVAPVRSIYASREGEIPAGRKKQLMRQLGSLDPRFSPFALPEDIMVEFARASLGPVRYKENHTDFAGSMENGDAVARNLLATIKTQISGMLSPHDGCGTDVESIIISAAANEYEQARLAFKHLWHVLNAFSSDRGCEDEMPGSFRTARDNLAGREVVAFVLAIILKCACSINGGQSTFV
jgi:hypothetical protein